MACSYCPAPTIIPRLCLGALTSSVLRSVPENTYFQAFGITVGLGVGQSK